MSLAGTEKSDNVMTKYVAYGEGFAFLSTGKPGSAILFSSSKLEAKCRSLTFFFSDDGMTGYDVAIKINITNFQFYVSAAILKFMTSSHIIALF